MCVSLAAWCSVAAPPLTPLVRCEKGAGWSVDEQGRLEPLGRVLRVTARAGGYQVEVDDGRAWTFVEAGGEVSVVSGAIDGPSCRGALIKERWAELVTASASLKRQVVASCRALDGSAASLTLRGVLLRGSLELFLQSESDGDHTFVVDQLEPALRGTFVRCFSSAGRHCEAIAAPTLTWDRGARLTVQTPEGPAAYRCNLDREVLVRALEQARASP